MSRSARTRRTFFFEEPIVDGALNEAETRVRQAGDGLFVCVAHVPAGTCPNELVNTQRALVNRTIEEHEIAHEVLWYYTPMALPFTRHLSAPLVVYDCMDELSGFAFAPRELHELELELFERADLVFTGGHSLYEKKRRQHGNVHAFPSSVDAAHFAVAREPLRDPDDQQRIGRPRLGYFGVIDERLDLELVGSLAEARPDWHVVMVGPVVKIDPESLPRLRNIHWLGQKDYAVLPRYVAGWDVALMPFALNAATEFISPTKSLEYLAAGKSIVSTAIADVVAPYGRAGLARIADKSSFVSAVEAALADDRAQVRARAERWVAGTSWQKTWEQMTELMDSALLAKHGRSKGSLATCSIT
jgi:glycosyltransferase involved in cell wall biosynthesis